jgi:DNA gyrase subunit A
MGVRGIRLGSKDDRVIGMLVVKREGSILVVTDHGYGKRSNLENYRTQNRGGKGVITIKTTNKVGQLIGIMEAIDSDDLMLITDKGIMIRQPVEQIRTIGRNTQGVRLAKLDEGTQISSATRIFKDEDVEENENSEIPNIEG